jgi:hypothetical protein
MLGVTLPALREGAGRRHAAHAQCLGAHRRRQHHHADLGPLRDGPGRLHLDADADRRGTERRPQQDAGGDRAARRKAYGNALLGAQITGGSTSVRDGWEKLRMAGAQVREMLVTAARALERRPRPAARRNGIVSAPRG